MKYAGTSGNNNDNNNDDDDDDGDSEKSTACDKWKQLAVTYIWN